MNGLVRAFLVTLLLTISACASVPMAPPEYDFAAKTFRPPPPDRAHVYVYRNESIGAAIKMDLRLDGYSVGTTVAKSFTLLPVRPGYHSLVSESENKSELPFYAQPGETLFVWQEVKMGLLYARTKLQLVSPAEGRAGVGECNLIASPPPSLPPPSSVRPVGPPPPAASPIAAPTAAPTS
jgi:hypothetical protein